jgi:hypothetical protein
MHMDNFLKMIIYLPVGIIVLNLTLTYDNRGVFLNENGEYLPR